MLKNRLTIPYRFFFCLMLFVSSCKEKQLQHSDMVQHQPSAVRLDAQLRPYSRQYDYISFKTKLDYEDGKNAFMFTANVRIRQDSLIWISITGPLNIEVARAVVNLDSFKLINKLSGEREVHSLAYLNRFFPGELDYFQIQDFLLGNPLAASKVACVVDSTSDIFQFTQEDAKLKVVHRCNTKNYTLQDVLLKDNLINQHLDATFENYQKIDSGFFSCARTIQIQRGNQQIKIKGEVYKFRAHEPLDYPF